MAEYKILQISQQPPRVWEGTHGKVYYIKVQLSGHSKPVEIGKKSPDALKVGDTLHGTIEHTEYPTDKFKAEKPTGGYTGGGIRQFKADPDKQSEIRAEWAIGKVVEAMGIQEMKMVEIKAKELYEMVDRIRGKAPKTESADTTLGFTEKNQPTDVDYDEPIKLEDIPF